MQEVDLHGVQKEEAPAHADWGQTTRLLIVLVVLAILGPCSGVASECHRPHEPAPPSLFTAP